MLPKQLAIEVNKHKNLYTFRDNGIDKIEFVIQNLSNN